MEGFGREFSGTGGHKLIFSLTTKYGNVWNRIVLRSLSWPASQSSRMSLSASQKHGDVSEKAWHEKEKTCRKHKGVLLEDSRQPRKVIQAHAWVTGLLGLLLCADVLLWGLWAAQNLSFLVLAFCIVQSSLSRDSCQAPLLKQPWHWGYVLSTLPLLSALMLF